MAIFRTLSKYFSGKKLARTPIGHYSMITQQGRLRASGPRSVISDDVMKTKRDTGLISIQDV